METGAVAAILKIVAEYGVLGLGWVAWLFTMFYLQKERRQYQELVIQIIKHFTEVGQHTDKSIEAPQEQLIQYKQAVTKLFGLDPPS